MKGKKLFINILACLVSFATTLGINFFLTPYITENVGTEAYGFVSLAINFVNYASIVTLAINSMASRFVSVSVFKKKYEDANRYFTSVLIANILIILILLIPSIFCVIYLEKLIVIPENLISSVKVLFSLIFINFYISLINTSYSVSTYAGDKIELFTLRNMESGVLKVVSMFALFYIFGADIIFVGIATILSTLYLLFFNIKYTKKFLPFIHIKKKYFDIKKVIEICLSGVWNTVTKIGQVLADGLDLLISNLFISPTAMGQLSIAKTISSSVSLLTVLLSNVFQPAITKSYAQNSESMIDEIKFSMKIVALFSNIMLIGIMCFAYQFYKLWLPSENIGLLTFLTLITLIGSVVSTSVNILFNVFTITNKIKLNSLVTLGVGCLNVLVLFIILKLNLTDTPIYFVAGVSVITGLIKNLTFIPIYAAKCLNVEKTSFYMPIIKSILSSITMAFIFVIISKLIVINTWIKLLIIAVICAIIGFAVSVLILFDKNEREKVKNVLNTLLKEKRWMSNEG